MFHCMACSYPMLRNAYIESGPKEDGVPVQWAVLVSNNGSEPKGSDSCVDEVYR